MDQTVVLVGDVDHGKSSLLGRMACELGVATDQHIARLAKAEKPNYALILDALSEEQREDRTVGLARFTIRYDEKVIRFLDAPGHKELLRSLVTGLSLADTVLFVVSAEDGVTDAFREQLALLRFFAPRRTVLAITKTDLQKVSCREIVSNIENALSGIMPTEVFEVSSSTGNGIKELAQALFSASIKASSSYDLPMAPVVSITGVIGTEIFATLLSGQLCSGASLMLLGDNKQVVLQLLGEVKTITDGAPFRFTSSIALARGDILVGDPSDFSPPIQKVTLECCLFEKVKPGSTIRLRIGARRYELESGENLIGGFQKVDVPLIQPVWVPRVSTPSFLNRALVESDGMVVGVGVVTIAA